MNNPIKSFFWKKTMKYGTLLGLVLVIYSLVLWMAGHALTQSLSYVSYLFLIVGLYLGIKTFRDNDSGGFISYSRALGVGTTIGLFAGILTGAYTFVLFKFLDPALLDQMRLLAEEAMYQSGIPEAQIEAASQMQKKFMQPGILAITTVFGNFLSAFVISLIVSIFVKKEASPFEQV